MKNIYNKIFIILAIVVTMAALYACGTADKSVKNDNGKINVVATIFPEYDFLRQIAGDHINLTMLLTPGAESHSYEPTPKDILNVQNSAIFVYVGGDSDAWVSGILDSMDQSNMKIVTLMDCVNLVEEESVEGMVPDKDQSTDEPEMDVY